MRSAIVKRLIVLGLGLKNSKLSDERFSGSLQK